MGRFIEQFLEYGGRVCVLSGICFLLCYVAILPFLLIISIIDAELRLDFSFLTVSGQMLIWIFPPFLIALVYSVIATPFFMWAEGLDAYETYCFDYLKYALFVPFYIIVGGIICTNNLCYI